jgi:DNA replication protein DnaC
MEALQENLKQLRLHYLSENLDDFLIHSQKESMTPVQIIERMVKLELIEKNKRSISRRIHLAKIGKFRPINEFDWNHPEQVDKQAIMSLFELDFIAKTRNVIFAGPQGLGKTMIARNLAHKAAIKGYSAYVTTAAQLVMDLGSAESSAALMRKLKTYTRPNLLVIDEIGYLSFDQKSADLIFEIINRRYEKGSIIITTNLAFKDWGEIFPGAPCVTAMIDRLTHHCDIIKLNGPSYRTKESKEKRS